ncbi:DMT family transporter [Burkholderia vietnamiensis]|nr:DMT family transporter [Burkholderia vietnamiensis]
MTLEQRHAEPVLDGSHAPADRAVRDAGHLGRRQKRAVTRDRADGLEARERRSRARLRQRTRLRVRRTVATAALGYAAWSFALGHFGAARASSFLYLTPAVATAMSMMLTGERPGIGTVGGGLLAIVGVVVVALRGRA